MLKRFVILAVLTMAMWSLALPAQAAPWNPLRHGHCKGAILPRYLCISSGIDWVWN